MLAKKLKSMSDSAYGSQEKLTAKKAEVAARDKETREADAAERAERRERARAARKAQKSTETNESVKDEQTVTEGENGAESDTKMSVVGESALIADELNPAWWFIGKDGKRRYEISDSEMDVDLNGYVEQPQYVKDYVKHDRLFSAYPEIRDYKVQVLDIVDGVRDRLGSFDHKSKTIKIKRDLNDDQAKEAFLHEIQHVIQHIEKLTGGMNRESAGHYLFNKAYDEVKNKPEFNAIKSAEGKRKYVVREVERRFSDYLDTNGLELKPGFERNFETASIFAYSNYYGEIEARNTADKKRREMTEADLAANRAENNGEIYNRAEEDAKFIDNLIEIGYTENEARKFKRYGVDSYDNQRTDARKPDISTSTEPSREGRLGVGEDGQDDGSWSIGSERGVHRGRGIRGTDTGTGRGGKETANGLLSGNKFSLSPETDSDYLSAVENGDMETAQRMVDEAAKAAGYTIKAYHGTSARFTQFDPDEMSPREGSYFFAENREDAAAYGKNIYEVYLTDRNLADYDNQPTEFYKLRDKRQQVEWLKERGYEGWCADMDSEGWGEYSVFSPSQVKSADPVTYDDNGNVIPLSERFNAENEDIRYSLSGYTADGIEVYETSEEVLNLPWKERKKRYLSFIEKQYRGRTAKFERNGHVYYAEFDRQNASKAIFGDSRSDDAGRDALINTGADGYVFELVENSNYDGSGKDKKGHNNTDYFDYFIKTVQIDGKVFDLLADVKKQYGGDEGYVYTIRLRENKNIKASPIQRGQALLNNSGNALIDKPIVTQDDGVVNTQSMQNSENDTDGRMSVTEEVLDGSDSQSFADMIAETRANKESNAALVEKFLNERGKHIDGSSVRKFLNGIIGAYGSEAWYGNVEKKYREMFEKVYNNKGGKVDADTVTEMFREVATEIYNGTVEDELEVKE